MLLQKVLPPLCNQESLMPLAFALPVTRGCTRTEAAQKLLAITSSTTTNAHHFLHGSSTKIIAHHFLYSSTTTNAEENERALLLPNLNTGTAPRLCSPSTPFHHGRSLPSSIVPHLPSGFFLLSHRDFFMLRHPEANAEDHLAAEERWTGLRIAVASLPGSILPVRPGQWCFRSFSWLRKEKMNIW
jgi:hypothetical protein